MSEFLLDFDESPEDQTVDVKYNNEVKTLKISELHDWLLQAAESGEGQFYPEQAWVKFKKVSALEISLSQYRVLVDFVVGQMNSLIKKK